MDEANIEHIILRVRTMLWAGAQRADCIGTIMSEFPNWNERDVNLIMCAADIIANDQ